ncbi:hypothetical protein [Elizabethkingia anophelis]|uniref:hypothetical protein n=1 Tax=Elizabethkingia anophelis TaxID=1117645 RepID=UPI000A7AC336|nr:hypothetical protein [Elizabethkingia anophelis]
MKTFLILVLCLVMGSCVSFSKRMIKEDLMVVTKDNVNLIEGKYYSAGYEHIDSNRNKSEKVEGFSKMLSQKSIVGSEEIDKVEIKLKPLAKNKSYQLEFRLTKNDSLKYVFRHNAKLKKGLFLLGNYTSECHGIPYLLGGCQKFQSRMGLTKDNHLLVQDYYENSGGALFIMWAGYSINYGEKYKRIQ